MAVGLNRDHKVMKNFRAAAGAAATSPSTSSLWGDLVGVGGADEVVCQGAVQGVQGQAGAQVHPEKGGHACPCQEEARGNQQRFGS